ncbi:hypothetical protein [Caballeronia sp. LZ019]|uniref:hypothetical protein n=1 Tax=Caballeronia sp. LZ019 TaxID=3038555 RepID=UPI00285C748E|nr:hypothetical protein [Caballeronia sp. LZ019]MDR5809937.1 hypothetical protein [Caballeronia sp. LZ019]
MDVQQLVSQFLSSAQGAQAAQALNNQGFSAENSLQILGAAAESAHAHAEEHGQSMLGEHAGKSFFAAFATGLLRGDGFLKSLAGGGEGIMTGRVAEILAARIGLDPATASSVAAVATPFIVSFLREKLA